MSELVSGHSRTSGNALEVVERRERFRRVRQLSERIAAPLSPEDCVIQSMPDVSPTRWHLAHTTWFFETFILRTRPDYRPFDDRFEYLFNSYYNSVGEQFPRHRRGLISRPGLAETLEYRQYVDEQVQRLLANETWPADMLDVLELGLHHEQQHQELMLTDIKHVLSCNPLFPVYDAQECAVDRVPGCPLEWMEGQTEIAEVGYEGTGFCFDNELPRHRVLLQPHALASRCVTNGEYLEFVEAGGYQDSAQWLSLGWATVTGERWQAPLYWVHHQGSWHEFTLRGLQPLDLAAPVCHVSYFEADAYARWAGHRLPTEFEWETRSAQIGASAEAGVFADRLLADGQSIHPQVESSSVAGAGWMGNVWEWTASQYTAYPGYTPPAGALGEYNGKFMCNQFVLRGGSCASSADHVRTSYRNFFPPDARWQFSGIRLARRSS